MLKHIIRNRLTSGHIISIRHECPSEGHVNAPHGGISIDMSQLDQVIEVNNEDLDVVVQPGVTREWLNNYLRDSGLFFPIDPMAGTMQVQEFDAQPPADISSLAR